MRNIRLATHKCEKHASSSVVIFHICLFGGMAAGTNAHRTKVLEYLRCLREEGQILHVTGLRRAICSTGSLCVRMSHLYLLLLLLCIDRCDRGIVDVLLLLLRLYLLFSRPLMRGICHHTIGRDLLLASLDVDVAWLLRKVWRWPSILLRHNGIDQGLTCGR